MLILLWIVNLSFMLQCSSYFTTCLLMFKVGCYLQKYQLFMQFILFSIFCNRLKNFFFTLRGSLIIWSGKKIKPCLKSLRPEMRKSEITGLLQNQLYKMFVLQYNSFFKSRPSLFIFVFPATDTAYDMQQLLNKC